MSLAEHNKEPRPQVGQQVIWFESRKWGGKQNQPATYLTASGSHSALIRLGDNSTRIVRLKSLRWEVEQLEGVIRHG